MHTNASGNWAHYDLHTDHLGSTVLTTNQGNAVVSNERYFAYGRTRYGGIGVTDHCFTGQKRDRGPIGRDTLVPDSGTLFDYNLIYMDSVFRVIHTASAQTPVRRARQSATSHLRWRRCQG